MDNKELQILATTNRKSLEEQLRECDPQTIQSILESIILEKEAISRHFIALGIDIPDAMANSFGKLVRLTLQSILLDKFNEELNLRLRDVSNDESWLRNIHTSPNRLIDPFAVANTIIRKVVEDYFKSMVLKHLRVINKIRSLSHKVYKGEWEILEMVRNNQKLRQDLLGDLSDEELNTVWLLIMLQAVESETGSFIQDSTFTAEVLENVDANNSQVSDLQPESFSIELNGKLYILTLKSDQQLLSIYSSLTDFVIAGYNTFADVSTSTVAMISRARFLSFRSNESLGYDSQSQGVSEVVQMFARVSVNVMTILRNKLLISNEMSPELVLDLVKKTLNNRSRYDYSQYLPDSIFLARIAITEEIYASFRSSSEKAESSYPKIREIAIKKLELISPEELIYMLKYLISFLQKMQEVIEEHSIVNKTVRCPQLSVLADSPTRPIGKKTNGIQSAYESINNMLRIAHVAAWDYEIAKAANKSDLDVSTFTYFSQKIYGCVFDQRLVGFMQLMILLNVQSEEEILRLADKYQALKTLKIEFENFSLPFDSITEKDLEILNRSIQFANYMNLSINTLIIRQGEYSQPLYEDGTLILTLGSSKDDFAFKDIPFLIAVFLVDRIAHRLNLDIEKINSYKLLVKNMEKLYTSHPYLPGSGISQYIIDRLMQTKLNPHFKLTGLYDPLFLVLILAYRIIDAECIQDKDFSVEEETSIEKVVQFYDLHMFETSYIQEP